MFEVERFYLAKYPITNAQYQAFVDASDGYRKIEWWDFSTEAKTWRNKNAQPQPTTFEGDDRPRTNVTWYEALAFCRWLSRQSGQTITLPTEQQWQRAAQGDDNRRYPWGDEFDEARCNFNSRETTPVDYYPAGVSPYGVMDLCGNVWEWCLTEWGTDSVELTGSNIRSLRGCSYYENRANRLLLNYRSGGNPPDRNFFTAFRIARIN
jgi:formylglycine-generating enzyme required for sulfatase activity